MFFGFGVGGTVSPWDGGYLHDLTGTLPSVLRPHQQHSSLPRRVLVVAPRSSPRSCHQSDKLRSVLYYAGLREKPAAAGRMAATHRGSNVSPRTFSTATVIWPSASHIVAGYICRNTFSVFYPAIVEEFGWTRGNTSLIYSINVLVYGAVAPFAGGLADRFRPRYVLASGALITGIGMSLCCLASDPWQFYLLYGVLAAVGLSIAGWVPVATILTNWFVRRRALVFGVLGAGFGLSLIAAHTTQYIILSLGWRAAYLVIGLCVAVSFPPPECTSYGALRRRKASSLTHLRGEAETQPAKAAEGGPLMRVKTHEWTLAEALRAPVLAAVRHVALHYGQRGTDGHLQQVYFYLTRLLPTHRHHDLQRVEFACRRPPRGSFSDASAGTDLPCPVLLCLDSPLFSS
jgi:hypothetical protein